MCSCTSNVSYPNFTEALWKSISQVQIKDDQKKLNMALDHLHLTFNARESNSLQSWQGKAPLMINMAPSSLRVTILPMKKICRGKACEPSLLPDCYVWHQGGDHDFNAMKVNAGKAKVWLLRDNWSNIGERSSLTGIEWLKALTIEE